MKRKLQKLTTKDLRNIFTEHIETTHLSEEILDLLPERKIRQFIIEKLMHEFSISYLNKILIDY